MKNSTANQGVSIQPEIQRETTNHKQFQQIDLGAFVPQTPVQAAEPPRRYSRGLGKEVVQAWISCFYL